jgi:hypothetical protein
MAVSASATNTFTVANVANPSTAQGYGPFKIVTRHGVNGQIMDANYVFGSVGIAGAHGTISNLTVAYVATSSGLINATSQSVNFTFTISRDLWKHDMFVIKFDNNFNVAAGVTCTSYVTGATDINYYNTTTAGDHALDCKETA